MTTDNKYIWLVSIILCGVLVIGGVLSVSGEHPPPPVAVDGVMDLNAWTEERDGQIKLVGAWEFYWAELLSADDFSQGRVPERTGWFPMPRVWNGIDVGGRKLGGNGFATFRLRLRLGPEQKRLALMIPYALTAYCLWVDDRLAA